MSQTDNNISKSKAKRLAQENARKEQRRKKRMAIFWAVLIPVLIIALIVGIVLYYRSTIVDYSKYLTSEGLVDVNIDNYVTTSYQNMSFSKADLLPSDETVDADIEAELDNHATLETDTSLKAADGDKVNITYTSTMDGIEYDTVSANDGGYDMTLGEGTLAPEVDEAVIGKHPGDEVSVTVNQSSPDASGNEVVTVLVYDITVEGIWVAPELEAMVSEFYPEYADVDAYRQSIIDGYYDENLTEAIRESISLNCVINSVPEGYYNNTKKIIEKTNEDNFNYYKGVYASYGLTMGSIYEMFGFTTQAEYDAFVEEQTRTQVNFTLACQAIYKAAGLTNTKEDVKAYYTELGVDDTTYSENIQRYGYNYMASNAMTGKVVEYLKGVVTITE